MCGLAGLISAKRVDRSLIEAMIRPIRHRGPDDDGVWIDEGAGVALGHGRLAIVDPSASGRQPMASASGRYVLSYNGEIYNHAELRRELQAAGAQGWRGHSDTETLLAAIEAWGLEEALRRSVGMFALALWDREDRLLHLARDRFGEKPLYYGWAGGDFLFGSELKALRAQPRFDNGISRTALRLFTARMYVPAPLSIYERIFKLEPGCVLSLTPRAALSVRDEPPAEGTSERGLSLTRYWSYREVVAAGLEHPLSDEQEALEQLEASLLAAARGQLMADVPVGAFLSGGIDSSTIVGFCQQVSARPVKTYTIGLHEEAFDEADHARAVARHLGTDHHEHLVTTREARDVLPLLPAMYDEPFADSSQIPTFLVSRFARQHVKVALSGDGGDELFGGYNRYFGTARAWTQMNRLPAPLRKATGGVLGEVSPAAWNRLRSLAPGSGHAPYFGAKVQKALRIIGRSDGLGGAFEALTDEWYGEPSPVLGENGARAPGFELDVGRGAPAAVRMMYCDARSYLPDDILCKVDRASMAVSLETRVPFLDHRVAELAARIPLGMKIRGGTGKLILRKLLYRMAPAELFERPKAGFGIPIGQWIRGDLRPWAESLLDERRLRSDGFFDAPQVRRRWDEHLSGTRDVSFSIWNVLMFQAWLEHWKATPRESQLAQPSNTSLAGA